MKLNNDNKLVFSTPFLRLMIEQIWFSDANLLVTICVSANVS